MDQTLTRFAYTKDGVFGRWGPWTTVEEEWRDNRPRISCIPTGSYLCKRTVFHRGGYPTYEITGVPGRTLIKIHRANTEEDLLGCVGLGLTLGVLRVTDEDSHQLTHKLAALASRKAFDAWMTSMGDAEQFTLHIVDYEPPTKESTMPKKTYGTKKGGMTKKPTYKTTKKK